MSDDIVERLRAPPLAERNEGIKIEAADEIERLRAALGEIRAKCSQMAEDDALWFRAETAGEAYVQFELRELCAVIEGVSPDECARRALGEAKADLAVKLPRRRPHGSR